MHKLALLPFIFLISLVLTMVGLGGGLIFSPLFILMSFPLNTAVATSLFLNGIAASGACVNYFRKGMVDVKAGIPLLISSTLAAPLGAAFMSRIDTRVFAGALVIVMLAAAVRMLLGKTPKVEVKELPFWKRIAGGTVIGGVIGFIAGLLGIGGGVFIVPLLIYILKLDPKRAAATSIFVVLFSSFSGFLAHIAMAQLDWPFVLMAAVSSFAGGQAGSKIMSERLKGGTVKKIFGIVLLLFCLKIIQKFWLQT